MKVYDVIIVGAGAAGLTAARTAEAQNKQVLILEMGNTAARKVEISGGGGCNITNSAVSYGRYFGENSRFVYSAISKTTPTDILFWATQHNLQPIEKTTGRFFCAAGAGAVKDALLDDIKKSQIIYNACVNHIEKQNNLFCICSNQSKYYAKSVIVATGGISFDTVGVSDVGYKIAKSFGHKIVPVRPALCAMKNNYFPTDFAGISVPVEIRIEKRTITDTMLFTHFGIGGPAIYRASLHNISDGFYINMLPDINVSEILMTAKQTCGKKTVAGVISQYLPARVAKWIAGNDIRKIADITKDEIRIISEKIHKIFITGDSIALYSMKTAEVVRGGVATDMISSKTMESKLCKNLFFVGEVLDIAGDLGGFNLHWAWASGGIAGMSAPSE